MHVRSFASERCRRDLNKKNGIVTSKETRFGFELDAFSKGTIPGREGTVDNIRSTIHNLIKELITGRSRKPVLALAAIVVFVTTYTLILPGFTLDARTAAEKGGIEVSESAIPSEDADEAADGGDEDSDDTDKAANNADEAADSADKAADNADETEPVSDTDESRLSMTV